MFSQETIRFLNDLRDHNSRDWFQSQKQRYEAHVKTASKTFAAAMERLLSDRYDVSVTAKLYRINRDLRFSKDKTPYNTHVHMSFLDAGAAAAWMIGLETDQLVIGFGAFAFDPKRLARWRERVSGPAGEQLLGSLQELQIRLEPPELKRSPAPYAADHPATDLLRRKGFAVWLRDMPVETAFGEDAPARLLEKFEALGPIRRWFVNELN
ncbi:TIGR02453 family protein [Altererythrobacter sp.]|uniref:TIGR02453 family protein n=1 Tax=Altererythrobacter sp. TaxID=1872480 RepID=UPI003D09A9F4